MRIDERKTMKKKYIVGIKMAALAALFAFTFKSEEFAPVENDNFSKGEVLEYRIHYGLVTGGDATVRVDEQIHTVNNRDCYKVDVFGRSSGTVGALFRIRDTWRSYIDTTSLITHKAYKNIEEAGYRHRETIYFDQQNDIAKVKTVDVKKNNKTDWGEYKIPDRVQDIVSGFYYLRTVDFDKLKSGEIITVNTFFDNKLYDFKVKYLGKETIKTSFGKIKALKLVPVMPKNDRFSGKDAVKVWMSDDDNKILLRAQVELLIGSLKIDLTKYSGLKHKLTFAKK